MSLHKSYDGMSDSNGVVRVAFDCMPARRLALSATAAAAVAVGIFVTTIEALIEEEWIHWGLNCGRHLSRVFF